MACCLALARAGESAAPAVPELLARFDANDYSSWAGQYLALALTRIGPAARDALPKLRQEHAAATGQWFRLEPAWVMVCIDPEDSLTQRLVLENLAALAPDLAEGGGGLGQWATVEPMLAVRPGELLDERGELALLVESLIAVGPPAIPALIQLFEGHPRARVLAAAALCNIVEDPDDGWLRVLTEALNDPETQEFALTALGEMGGRARPALPALLACGSRLAPGTSEAWASSLLRIAPEDRAVCEALREHLLKDFDWTPTVVVHHAAHVPRTAAAGVIPLLYRMPAERYDHTIVLRALEALGEADPR